MKTRGKSWRPNRKRGTGWVMNTEKSESADYHDLVGLTYINLYWWENSADWFKADISHVLNSLKEEKLVVGNRATQDTCKIKKWNLELQITILMK